MSHIKAKHIHKAHTQSTYIKHVHLKQHRRSNIHRTISLNKLWHALLPSQISCRGDFAASGTLPGRALPETKRSVLSQFLRNLPFGCQNDGWCGAKRRRCIVIIIIIIICDRTWPFDDDIWLEVTPAINWPISCRANYDVPSAGCTVPVRAYFVVE